MKKRQSFFCIALLSTVLVGNVFAGPVVSTSVFGVLGTVIDATVAFLRGDSCPVRQCQDCRPNEVPDENGNCRPREN